MTTATATGPAPTWGERILGGAAYFCWALPPFYLVPLLIYWWKRKTSRFVALHAVQSVLLAFALVFIWFVLIVVSFLMAGLVRSKAQGTILNWTTISVMVGMMVWGYMGMPIGPLRGRPAALPVLARWAERIIASPPGEGGATTAGKSAAAPYTAQRPEDRLLAGAAYLSIVSGLFFIGPLAVYLWKRRTSRFVGLHSLQALFLHLAVIPAMAATFGTGFVVAYLIEQRGRHWSDLASAAGVGGYYAAILLPNVILWRGFAAMLGPPDAVPLFGRVARWIAGRK